MRRILSVFLIICLISGLFAACSQTVDELDLFVSDLAAMEHYSFTAVGEVTFYTVGASQVPLQYMMQGTRTSGNTSATLYYTDAGGRLPGLSLVYANRTSYLGFVPFVQGAMDQVYAIHGALDLESVFEDSGYLEYTAVSLEDFPLDFPVLAAGLGAGNRRQILSNEGIHSLTVSGDQLHPGVLVALSDPFELLASLNTLAFPPSFAPEVSPVRSPLLAGELSEYTLDLTFTREEDANVFTVWITLTAPGLMTITADVVYREASASAIAPPQDAVDLATFQAGMYAFHEMQAREIFLIESGFDFIYDLPELQMVGHDSESDLLIPFYMEIGGESVAVSLMEGASNTATEVSVFSFTPSMSLSYTTLDAHSASLTMALHVLQTLDLDAFDAENFQRTAMRLNAHNTAAVNALYYDDLHVGRTLHIYVLQNLEDSDYALFLSVVVMIDNLSFHAVAVLDELGFLIGIDFMEYVTRAAEAE